MDRRSFITNCSVAASAAVLAGCGADSSADNTNSAVTQPDLFDFKVSTENLEAFVKVMGDLAEKPVWQAAQGHIYLIREGEMPLPLIGVEGLRYVRFNRIEGGFTQMVRDWAFYTDRDSGEILTEYTNPLTGTVSAPHPIFTGLQKWDLLAETGQDMEGYEGDAWLIDRPFRLPWIQENNDISVTLELLVKYASGIGGGEWVHMMTGVDELNDPGLTSTSCRIAWTGHSPVMRWLGFGDMKGRTLWQSIGRKHETIDTLRPEFVHEVEKRFPGSLAAPETYQKSE